MTSFLFESSKVGYIYVIKDPRDSLVRYVGQTTDIPRRWNTHLSITVLEKEKTYKSRWILSLLKKGLLPIFEVLECTDLERLNEREIYWLLHYQKESENLTNTRAAGDAWRPVSLEYKEKIRKARQGVFRKRSANATSFIGVSKRYGYAEDVEMFAAYISVKGTSYTICSLPTAEACAYYYDCAALHFYGDKARTNGVGKKAMSLTEIRRELTIIKKAGCKSYYLGVHFNKGTYVARIIMKNKERLEIARSKSPEVCARIYDACARYYYGIDAATNFTGITAYDIDKARSISKTLTKGKQRSRFSGVTIAPSKEFPWSATIYTGGKYFSIGYYKTEEEAAKMYDACVRYYAPERDTNFEGDLKLSIEEARAMSRKKPKSSSYYGVSLGKNGKYCAYHCKARKKTTIGYFVDEEEAAKAVDRYLLKNKIDKPLNFPDLLPDYEKELLATVE